jgi:hypothetical protein
MNDPFDLLQDTNSLTIIGDIKRNWDVNILLQAGFTSKKTNQKCLPLYNILILITSVVTCTVQLFTEKEETKVSLKYEKFWDKNRMGHKKTNTNKEQHHIKKNEPERFTANKIYGKYRTGNDFFQI